MISSVNIQGYRGLNHFEMNGLGRVNLLVGTNNSGKTSVLEAISLLMSNGDPIALWQIAWRRGERFVIQIPSAERDPAAVNRQQVELEVCHLFAGHDIHTGSKFTVSAKNENPERHVTFSIVELSPKDRAELFGPSGDISPPSRWAMQVKGSPQPSVQVFPLTRNLGITPEVFVGSRRVRSHHNEPSPSVFVTTDSLGVSELVSFWNKIALTPQESLVLKALKFIDPEIERIAIQAPTQPYFGPGGGRGGFIVKRLGIEQPIPVGSMGDGIWRMLALAIAITQCRGGMLLIDEIDTGLHYSVMAQMWQLIFSAAKEFGRTGLRDDS